MSEQDSSHADAKVCQSESSPAGVDTVKRRPSSAKAAAISKGMVEAMPLPALAGSTPSDYRRTAISGCDQIKSPVFQSA